MPSSCILFALVSLLAPALCLQAQTTSVPAPARSVPAKPSSPAPGFVAPQKNAALDYSSEPFIIEHEATVFRYRADGTGDRTLSATVLLQSDSAIRQFGLLSFAYAADSEAVELHYVRVQQPDGTVITTDPGAAQDEASAVTREAPLYSDLHQLQVPVRGLAVGDRLSYEVVIHTRKAEAPGQFWNALYFEATAVALDQVVELRFPAAMPVKVLSALYPPKLTSVDGDRVYHWHSAQTKPSVATGKAAQDASSPSTKTVPDIAWTTFADWGEVGAWYRDLQAQRAIPDAAIRAKAAALVAGAATPEQKLDRIYSFVSMQIRYIGVDFGVGRYQPHTADEVLANGYGDCKDKHTLLAALLTAQGFHVDPVLIGAGIVIDKDLPSPENFNHVITAVEEPGGKRLWLDSTAEVAPPGMLSAILRDKDALLIPSGAGTPVLVKTPAAPPFAAFDTYEAHATLTKDGKLDGHFDATLHGDLELLCRAALFSGGRAQWTQIGQGISSIMGFGGTVSDFQPTAVDTPGQPLHFTYDYERDQYGDWPNHRILSLLPYNLFAQATLSKQPDDPIQLGAPRIETAKSTITLPPGFSAPTLPQDQHIQSSFASYDLTYAQHGSDIVAQARLQVRSASIPASGWTEYNSFNTAIGNTEQFVTLAEVAPGASPETAAPQASQTAAAVHLNTATQSLVAEGLEAVHRNDLLGAQTKLKAAQAIDPNAPGIWVLAGTIAAMQRQWPDADIDLHKEISLHPDEQIRVLPVLLWVQRAEHHPVDEIATLELLRAADPESLQYTRLEADLLSQEKRNEEAVSMLEGAALRHPGDKPTMFELARIQFAADRPTEAKVYLEAALDGATDPGTLNDGAYLLADHNLDLPLARSDTLNALSKIGAETKQTTLANLTSKDLQQQMLLAATWDTLGWIDYKNGDLAAAEDLLRAAWGAMQSPDTGYHLGMVYEKEGKPQQAVVSYELASAAHLGNAPQVPTELLARRNALAAQGLHANFDQPVSTILARDRSIDLPLLVHKSGDADFFLLASSLKIEAVQFVSGDPAFRDQGPAIQAALARNHTAMRWPAGSGAILVRRGILSCSPDIHACQFILFLPQDTALPGPAIQFVAGNGSPPKAP